MEETEIIQLLEPLLLQGGLIILFFSILWALGTRDRKQLLRIAHKLLHLLENGVNGDAENTQKGGDSYVSDDRKGND